MDYELTIIENGLQSWRRALPRFLVLMAVAAGLCSCGVYQMITTDPNDEEEGLRAAMDIMAPPLLITGDWSDTRAKNFENTSYYTELIRTRNEGKVTPDRSREILAAMDQVFKYTTVKSMTDEQLAKLIGPPDKTIVRSGQTIDVYQVHSPSGIQERWLVKD